MPVLSGAKQAARAPNLQIPHRDLKARAEFGKLAYRKQPLFGYLGKRLILPERKIGVAAARRTADAPAQLVELRKPKMVGVVDDDRIDVGDIKAGFDDRTAQKHVEFAVKECKHCTLEQPFAHLPMGHAYRGLGDELA
ncbi:hypothetical protein SDC9_184940 [bioreactor metagenome]|uniref:Uncharacterized protein n=1 Tax=bioreactor metagenome TaxID=1076179 RepID=A0A645HGB0_9ZZZZ